MGYRSPSFLMCPMVANMRNKPTFCSEIEVTSLGVLQEKPEGSVPEPGWLWGMSRGLGEPGNVWWDSQTLSGEGAAAQPSLCR